MLLINKILVLYLIVAVSICFAQQDQTDIIVDSGKESIIVLNDQLRKTSRRLRELEGGVSLTTGVVGILPTSKGGTGKDLSTASTGTIPYFSSTGVFGNIGIGTTNNVLTVSGGLPVWGSMVSNVQVFTSSGTFVAPSSISRVFLSICGGGAGGGEVGGGSGGNFVINYPYTVTGGNSYTVTVGAAGAGRVSGVSEETAGGNTTFDALTCNGAGADGAAPNQGIDASTSTGGSACRKGGNRGTTGGGGSPFGSGGAGGVSYTAGSGYCSGGGSDGSANGANGTQGIVIVSW